MVHAGDDAGKLSGEGESVSVTLTAPSTTPAVLISAHTAVCQRASLYILYQSNTGTVYFYIEYKQHRWKQTQKPYTILKDPSDGGVKDMHTMVILTYYVLLSQTASASLYFDLKKKL